MIFGPRADRRGRNNKATNLQADIESVAKPRYVLGKSGYFRRVLPETLLT